MDAREHIHELVDRVPIARLPEIEGLLEAMVNDVPALDEADARRLEQGRIWLKQHGGRGIPMEEVLAEFGLKPSDFPDDK
jgi:hypothetical protein